MHGVLYTRRTPSYSGEKRKRDAQRESGRSMERYPWCDLVADEGITPFRSYRFRRSHADLPTTACPQTDDRRTKYLSIVLSYYLGTCFSRNHLIDASTRVHKCTLVSISPHIREYSRAANKSFLRLSISLQTRNRPTVIVRSAFGFRVSTEEAVSLSRTAQYLHTATLVLSDTNDVCDRPILRRSSLFGFHSQTCYRFWEIRKIAFE